MLAIDIPGFADLRLEHLVLDFNGTLAVDGRLLRGVAPVLRELSAALQIHVHTADTFGQAAEELAGLPLRLVVIRSANQAEMKLELVRRLDVSRVAAIGNGRNDRMMLEAVALGIAVMQHEGAAQTTLGHADVVTPGILEALGLLQHPLRLAATLRA
ncbi:MAG TPA: HAD hydrolase family protein [Casimicrobiaceae bacterium]|nr:HAD hydrolase family protein [Casimicrobiaceae bacterium]